MERRSETTGAPDEAEPRPTLTSSLGRESTTISNAGGNEDGGQLPPPQHQSKQRDLMGNPTDSLHTTTPAANQLRADWSREITDRDRVNVTDNETLRPNISEVMVMERAPSNTALAESTVLEVQGRDVVRPLRDSGRVVDQLSGHMADINSQLKAAVQRMRLLSAEYAIARERSSRAR